MTTAVVGVLVVLGLVGTIIMGVQLAKLNSNINNSGGGGRRGRAGPTAGTAAGSRR